MCVLFSPSVQLAVVEHLLNLLSQQAGRRQGRMARIRIETRAGPQAPSRRSLISASHFANSKTFVLTHPLIITLHCISHAILPHPLQFSLFPLALQIREERLQAPCSESKCRCSSEIIVTTETRCVQGSAHVKLAELPTSRAFAPADPAPWQRRYRPGDLTQGPIGAVQRGRPHGGGTTRRANCVGTWCQASTTPSCC